MLTEEEIIELKNQLRDQIKHLPDEKRHQAESQIDSMSAESLEVMLNQQTQSQHKPQKGIFRMIVDGEILSRKIDENKESVAVLDIKPISPGHIIIIPKKVTSKAKDIPSQCFSLAKKVSKKVSSKLKPKPY